MIVQIQSFHIDIYVCTYYIHIIKNTIKTTTLKELFNLVFTLYFYKYHAK